MRRSVTWLVIAALGVVAALALADALRSGPTPRPTAAPTTTRPQAPTLVETLRHEGISGSVLYSDQDCILHSLLVPQMKDEVVRGDNGVGAFHMCRFGLADGRIVSDRAARDTSGLTVREGQVVSGGRVLLTHGDLVRAARRHPNIADYDPGIPLHLKVTGLTRVSQGAAVGLEIRARYLEPQYLAALFQGEHLRTIAVNFNHPYRGFFVSADGALAGSEDGTVLMLDGGSVDPPTTLPAGKTVAFSPDNRWTARVNGRSIFAIATPLNDEPGRIIRLPVPARDLVWEPGGVDPGAIVRAG